jgi:hypothetical protein
MKTLKEMAAKIPARGWKIRMSDLEGNTVNGFVQGVDPDRTIGIYNLVIGIDLEDANGQPDAACQ